MNIISFFIIFLFINVAFGEGNIIDNMLSKGEAVANKFGISTPALYAHMAQMQAYYARGYAMAAQAHANFQASLRARARVVPQLPPISELLPPAHTPVISVKDNNHWTYHYNDIANELVENRIYRVKFDDGTIIKRAPTKEVLDAVKKNINFIAYYRAQMEELCFSDGYSGSKNFATFLDFCVGTLRGLSDEDRNKKVTLERDDAPPLFLIRDKARQQQMIAIYRYLENKYTVYTTLKEKFSPADIELLKAFRNLIILSGIEFHPAWLFKDSGKVNLNQQTGYANRWKKYIVLANDALNNPNEKACIVPMPKPPEPQKPAPPKVPQQEIIIKLQTPEQK